MARTMTRFGRVLRDQWRRARDMERFVQFIVGGGLGLVAGLWLVTLFGRWSTLWLLGAALVLLGVAGLGHGIWSQVDY